MTAIGAEIMHGERRGPYLYNSILQLVYAVNPASVSKIVDSNGEPRVVYHGSAKDFDDFALDVAGRTNETESKLGIWFFECRDYVSNLSNNLAYGDRPDESAARDSKAVHDACVWRSDDCQGVG